MGSNQKNDLSGTTCSGGELAKLFGIQPRAIQALAEKGRVLRAAHGRYLRNDSILTYCTHLRESAAGRLAREGGDDGVSASADLKREQTALARARAVPSRSRAALPHLSAFDQAKIDELIRDALTDLPARAPEIEAGLGDAFRDDDELADSRR